MKKGIISCFTALLVGLTPVLTFGSNSDLSVVKAADLENSQSIDGYDYGLWNMNSTGSVNMQPGSNGTFTCSWNGIENCMFSTGKKSENARVYGNIAVNYDVDFQTSYDSNVSIDGQGWDEHGEIVEYHIIEAWCHDVKPGNSDSLGTVSSDGKLYDIYKVTRFIEDIIRGPYCITSYWSIQRNSSVQPDVMNNIKGTVTVSNHFKQWEEVGLTMNKINNDVPVSLTIDGYRSDGKAEAKKYELIVSESQPDRSTNTAKLKDAFAGLLKVGTSVSSYELTKDKYSIKNHFNSITPQNELKPAAIIDQYACKEYGNNVNTHVLLGNDAIMRFCSDKGIAMRGNTFVWSGYTPDWFFKEGFDSSGKYVSKDIMDKRLESFIKNTFDAISKKFPDLNLYAYDVCDRLFTDDGGGLNDSGWLKVYGDDSFIEKAFTYARKYAPSGCRLYLNDCNEYVPAKTNDIYNMAMKLKSKGIIDGIGMESFIDVSYPDVFSAYEKAMKKFISTGLDVQVTSLSFTSVSESVKEPLYRNIFRLCVENAPHVSSLTIWKQGKKGYLGDPNAPFLLDSGSLETEEYKSVMEYAKTIEDTAPVTTSSPVTTPAVTDTPVTTATVTTATVINPPATKTTITTATVINPPATTTTVTTQPVSAELKGDVDCSGTVTAADIVKMMQMMIGKTTLSAQGQNNADINKDGILSIVDLILLKSSLL